MSENIIIINTDGSVESRKTSDETMLEDMQKAVDGFIEIVRPFGRPGGDLVLVVNDCGMINGMKVNRVASCFYPELLFGPVAIVKEGLRDGEPDLIGLDDDEAQLMLRLLGGNIDG